MSKKRTGASSDIFPTRLLFQRKASEKGAAVVVERLHQHQAEGEVGCGGMAQVHEPAADEDEAEQLKHHLQQQAQG